MANDITGATPTQPDSSADEAATRQQILAAVSLLDQGGDSEKCVAAEILAGINHPTAFKLLLEMLGEGNTYVVAAAAGALGKHGNPDALPRLEKLRSNPSNIAISAATRAIEAIQKAQPTPTPPANPAKVTA